MSRPALPLSHPAGLLGTWFGSGLLPGAPGTWGTLAAIPFAWAIAHYAGGIALALAGLLALVSGQWASGVYARAAGRDDPPEVVIDEVAAIWLVLAAVPLAPVPWAIGFVFFRFADIVKLWPANLIDGRLKSGWGIMADDLVAALYAVAGLAVLDYFGVWA